MRIGKEFNETVEIVKLVLSGWKYRLISLVAGISLFGVLYYFIVAKVANNSLRISIMMSGAGYLTEVIASIFVISSLSGIYLSMIIFKFSSYHSMSGKGILGFIGSGIGAFGVGCPTCGAFLFGLIGMPLALMYLPFKGLELQAIGILVLIMGIWFTGKSIRNVCKIKTPK